MMMRAGGSEAVEALGGGAILAVSIVTAIAYAYSAKELEKEKEYIEAINELYKLFLAKLPEPGGKPLPPIFSKGTAALPTPTTCMQIDVLEDLYNIFPVYIDPHLRCYGHHVMNAMRALAKYYDWRINGRNWFWKGNKNDITSSVLSYLILMLSEHCVNFQGYGKDINTIQNIADFVNGFASLPMGMQGERFEHLTEAYNELMKAKAVLVEHSKSLSMDELIASYESSSASVADRMIRLATKLVVPNKHWNKVGYTTMDRLQQRVVSPKYKNGRSFKHWLFGATTYMPACLLSDWVQQNAKDYVDALNVDQPALDLSRIKFLPLDKNNPAYKDHLSQIKAAMKGSRNILTLKVKGNVAANATGSFVAVDDDLTVEKRANDFYNLSKLTNRVIVSQYLFSCLWKQLKELGELYVKKSHHCDYIFEVAQGLGKQMDDLSTELQDRLLEIEAVDLAGAMQQRTANVLLKEMKDVLTEAKDLSSTIKKISELHQARTKTKPGAAKATVHVHKEADLLLNTCYKISQTYGIDTGHPVVEVSGAAPAAVAANPQGHGAISRLELAKMQRKKDPALGLLYASIYEMRSYGLKLMKQDDSKGKVAVDLADELDEMVDVFYGQFQDGAEPSRDQMLEFKGNFNAKLISKNSEMAQHREAWLSIVGNILIALTGLGALVLAAKALYSKLSEGKFALFFSKTNRQQKLERVEEAVTSIPTPASAA